MTNARLASSIIAVLLTACGGRDDGGTAVAIAAAVAPVVQARGEGEAKVNAAERMQQLRDQADADARAARDAAFADVITVPAQAPADFPETCNAVAQAYDAFTTARLSGPELDRWNATKVRDLEKIAETCKGQDPRIAGCQASALTKAGSAFVAGDAAFILDKCQETIAGNAAAGAAP